MGPTPEELREQALNAQRTDKVEFKDYIVRIYDLSETEQCSNYQKDMKEIIDGVNKRTHVLFNHNREFVPAKATWMVNLEWGEFELKTEVVEPVKPQG